MISNEAMYMKRQMAKSDLWNRPITEIRRILAEYPSGDMISSFIKEDFLSLGGVGCYYYSDGSDNRLDVLSTEKKLLVYLHGGGNVLEITARTRAFASMLAESSKIGVLLIDFRLAPEHVFPAAHEDVMSVVIALEKLGFSHDKLGFIGDSAGCGLILSTMQTLQQTAGSCGAFGVFLCPMLDMTGSGDTHHTMKDIDPFSMADPLHISKLYAGDTPLAHLALSPLSGRMDGLPPLLVHGASEDVFYSDAHDFSKRALSAGVEVEFHTFEGLWHVFQLQYDMVPESASAIQQVIAWIRRRA